MNEVSRDRSRGTIQARRILIQTIQSDLAGILYDAFILDGHPGLALDCRRSFDPRPDSELLPDHAQHVTNLRQTFGYAPLFSY